MISKNVSLKFMNNVVFLTNHVKCVKTDIKLVTNKAKRDYLVLEPNYHKTDTQDKICLFKCINIGNK